MRIVEGVRVKDGCSGGWATISQVSGSLFRVNWDGGSVGKTWWEASDWIFDAPNDPRAPKGPIRTEKVTTRRIEPGVYGRLYVRGEGNFPFGAEKQVDVGFVARGVKEASVYSGYVLTASELRDLARVATELAEFLDAQ